MKNIVALALFVLPVVHQTEAMQLIHRGSNPTSRTFMSDAGLVTFYSDGSIKVDNYLGKGSTFHLSTNKEKHSELDATNNEVLRSSEGRGDFDIQNATFEGTELRHGDGTIETYRKVRADPEGRVIYYFLTISYPEGVDVTFDYDNIPSVDPYHARLALAFRFAINQAAVEQVRKLLQTIPTARHKDIINFKLHGDTALLAAVKEALRPRNRSVERQTALRHIIQLLLGAGADPEITDNQGQSPISLALEIPQLNLINIFMQAAGEPLFTAIYQGQRGEVDKFIERERRPLDEVRDNRFPGHTPLSLALTLAQEAENQNKRERADILWHIAQSLVNKGANLESNQVQAILKKNPKLAHTVMCLIQPLSPECRKKL